MPPLCYIYTQLCKLIHVGVNISAGNFGACLLAAHHPSLCLFPLTVASEVPFLSHCQVRAQPVHHLVQRSTLSAENQYTRPAAQWVLMHRQREECNSLSATPDSPRSRGLVPLKVKLDRANSLPVSELQVPPDHATLPTEFTEAHRPYKVCSQH